MSTPVYQKHANPSDKMFLEHALADTEQQKQFHACLVHKLEVWAMSQNVHYYHHHPTTSILSLPSAGRVRRNRLTRRDLGLPARKPSYLPYLKDGPLRYNDTSRTAPEDGIEYHQSLLSDDCQPRTPLLNRTNNSRVKKDSTGKVQPKKVSQTSDDIMSLVDPRLLAA